MGPNVKQDGNNINHLIPISLICVINYPDLYFKNENKYLIL